MAYQSDSKGSCGDATPERPLSKLDFTPKATGGVKAQEYIGGQQYPDIQTHQK